MLSPAATNVGLDVGVTPYAVGVVNVLVVSWIYCNGFTISFLVVTLCAVTVVNP